MSAVVFRNLDGVTWADLIRSLLKGTDMPDFGETVHVWPHPGVPVRQFDGLPRYIPADGMDLPWSPWLKERLDDGSIHLTDPAPKKASPPAPKKEG